MKGVVAIFVDKSGSVIEATTVFAGGGYGGFSQKDSQRIKAKSDLIKKVVCAYASPYMTDHLSQYTREKIFNDLIGSGATVRYEYIGYGEQQ